MPRKAILLATPRIQGRCRAITSSMFMDSSKEMGRRDENPSGPRVGESGSGDVILLAIVPLVGIRRRFEQACLVLLAQLRTQVGQRKNSLVCDLPPAGDASHILVPKHLLYFHERVGIERHSVLVAQRLMVEW